MPRSRHFSPRKSKLKENIFICKMRIFSYFFCNLRLLVLWGKCYLQESIHSFYSQSIHYATNLGAVLVPFSPSPPTPNVLSPVSAPSRPLFLATTSSPQLLWVLAIKAHSCPLWCNLSIHLHQAKHTIWSISCFSHFLIDLSLSKSPASKSLSQALLLQNLT